MKNLAEVRIDECSDARLLARAARLFLVWGNRRLADVAHTRRGKLLDARFAHIRATTPKAKG